MTNTYTMDSVSLLVSYNGTRHKAMDIIPETCIQNGQAGWQRINDHTSMSDVAGTDGLFLQVFTSNTYSCFAHLCFSTKYYYTPQWCVPLTTLLLLFCRSGGSWHLASGHFYSLLTPNNRQRYRSYKERQKRKRVLCICMYTGNVHATTLVYCKCNIHRAASHTQTRAGTILSKRFPEPLTSPTHSLCVVCCQALLLFPQPVGHSQCEAQVDPHKEHSVMQRGGTCTYIAHATELMHSEHNGTNIKHCYTIMTWLDDLMCDNSVSSPRMIAPHTQSWTLADRRIVLQLTKVLWRKIQFNWSIVCYI